MKTRLYYINRGLGYYDGNFQHHLIRKIYNIRQTFFLCIYCIAYCLLCFLRLTWTSKKAGHRWATIYIPLSSSQHKLIEKLHSATQCTDSQEELNQTWQPRHLRATAPIGISYVYWHAAMKSVIGGPSYRLWGWLETLEGENHSFFRDGSWRNSGATMLPVNWAFLPVRGCHGGMQHINVDMGGLLIPVIASLSSMWPSMTFSSRLSVSMPQHCGNAEVSFFTKMLVLVI